VISRRPVAGMTLVETLVALGISSVLLLGIMAIVLFSARSFAALTNYVDLDNSSRNALDVITRDVRQADALMDGSTEELMRLAFSGPAREVRYAYSSADRTLQRIDVSTGVRATMLRECDLLRFAYFQRNPIGGTYDQYPAATPALCKLIQLRWVCSRTILGQSVNTESVQSAKVVIRKQ
jgi:Tfp pilus assembly protein PilV